MRWRRFALISLGVNLALAAAWLAAPKYLSLRSWTGLAAPQPTVAPGRTNFVVRRQFFSWQEIESTDYPTYIANLRDIGCPEQTIRDIIIADVNALYARRRAVEVVTPDQQWWRSQPDTNLIQVAYDKIRALDEERRGLLTRLLGPSWEAGDLANLPRPSRSPVALDGPVLGTLPADTKQALQSITQRSQDRLQAYLEAQRQQGKPADPVELAKLRRQTRDELASVLSPGALEEFLLRYSQEAVSLRADFGQLEFFNPTSEEFRAVFRATDSIDQQLALLADSTDPPSVEARQQLENQRANAIKVALGPERYAQYQLLQDPLYRQAVAEADAAGTPEAVQTFYQINLAAAGTQQSILTNADLTAQQRAIQMKQLEVDALKASTLAAGQDLPPESQTPPPTPPKRTYTLRQGDSPAVVATIYGIPESAIRAANPNVNFSRLRPGDSIIIPGSALNPTTAPLITPNGP